MDILKQSVSTIRELLSLLKESQKKRRIRKSLNKIKKILKKLQKLIKSEGYIYAMCMIFLEDFRINPEELHNMNPWERLNIQEASLLLGFLIQDEISFSLPASATELIKMKDKTYSLLRRLHNAMNISPITNGKHSSRKELGNDKEAEKNFFGRAEMLMEPIFYSGTGVYDFQYLDFLDKKYKYDKHWLFQNRGFDLENAKKFVTETREILEKRSESVRHYFLKETKDEAVKRINKNLSKEEVEKLWEEIRPLLELHQYSDLFFDLENHKRGFDVFCERIIDLFCVRKSDYSNLEVANIIDHFTLEAGPAINKEFDSIGKYNQYVSHPIIKLSDDRYFVPITFTLYQAIYENPFHWMVSDKNYLSQLGKNRGKVGQEIAYNFLSQIFGVRNTYTEVKVLQKKGSDITDIDILCTLGSKALCVQVKSKGLTLISRQGIDQNQLNSDFKKAVQEAYNQGLISRESILSRASKFIDQSGNEIQFSEEIDEVYIMCLTTENYPSLIHQTNSLLDKEKEDPYPIVLTIFDLELLSHYLPDPYDFLYYIRQRISLINYAHASDEMDYLGFHLIRKLWKEPEADVLFIDNSYSQLIDRNYYPLKARYDVSDKGDAIKKRWSSQGFDDLCADMKGTNIPQFTDILFHLLDMSGFARNRIVQFISETKKKTDDDGEMHSAAMWPDPKHGSSIGLTFVSLHNDDEVELSKRLLVLCQVRKYKCKADTWIGFGSLKSSKRKVDIVIFDREKWAHDEELEDLVKTFDELGGKAAKITYLADDEKKLF